MSQVSLRLPEPASAAASPLRVAVAPSSLTVSYDGAAAPLLHVAALNAAVRPQEVAYRVEPPAPGGVGGGLLRIFLPKLDPTAPWPQLAGAAPAAPPPAAARETGEGDRAGAMAARARTKGDLMAGC